MSTHFTPDISVQLFLCNHYLKVWTICNILDNRGDETLEEVSENLTLTDLGAASQRNLTCAGVNLVGEGDSDALEILVYGEKIT